MQPSSQEHPPHYPRQKEQIWYKHRQRRTNLHPEVSITTPQRKGIDEIISAGNHLTSFNREEVS
jgi:hypothetical protein